MSLEKEFAQRLEAIARQEKQAAANAFVREAQAMSKAELESAYVDSILLIEKQRRIITQLLNQCQPSMDTLAKVLREANP